MIAVDYEEGKGIQDYCECAECGARLNLVWGGVWGIDGYLIKCTADPSHDKVVPVKSLTQMWRDGEELPSFIKDSIERRERRKMTEQNEVKAMVVKQDADKLGTYLAARFPKDLVKPGAALDFARWCIAHQLEPIRDCVPFQGTPYVCVEWLDRQASGDEKFKGYTYKVFSPQDKKSLDFDPKDLVVECLADWDGLEKPLVGLGVVTKMERESVTGGEVDEVTGRGYRSPVIRLHPQKMVFKRARAAALKQHYHIPAPILEELPYTTLIEAEYRIITEPSEGNEKVAEEAGEKVGAAAPTKAKAQAIKPVSSPAAETKPDEAIEGEGFHIDLTWLNESKKALKWTDDTIKTFLTKYKVSPTGTLTEVLQRLTREQAEDFVNQINSWVEKQQPGLFE